MGAPAKYKGRLIEGPFHARQVPVPEAKIDAEGLKTLHERLSFANLAELSAEIGRPIDEIIVVVPQDKEERLGQVEESCMRLVGKYTDEVFLANPASARISFPDELESDKLVAVFENTGWNSRWDEHSFGPVLQGE